jgi:SlyX protein
MEIIGIMEKRLTELEIKITYQEELLNELNIIVAKQQEVIDFLLKEYKKQMNQGHSNEPKARSLFDQLKEERPPHY